MYVLVMGESEEVTQSVQKTIQSRPSKICSESNILTSPYTGSGVHRGEVLDVPGETVPSRVVDPGSDCLCKILLQSRGVQTSTSVSKTAGADGSYAAISGICPLPHATHPVVYEAQRSCPRAQLVVSQASTEG